MLDTDLIRHGMEFVRAIENHQYEVSPQGIHFPKQRVFAAGQYRTWVNDRDCQIDPNVVPAEGLAKILKNGLNGTAWYIVPFTNDVTPLSTITALTFDSVLAEFTDYNELTRQAWVVPTDPAAGVYTNAASPAVFTASSAVGTTTGVDIIGSGLISASAKEATTGICASAAKFDGSRNVKTGDKLTVEFSISLASV
jgi:hypothetical protein